MSRSIPLHEGSGGMETVAWDLAIRLAQDHAVEVVTTTVPGRGDRFVHEGVPVSALRGTPPGRYSAAWWRATARLARTTEARTVLSVSAGATAMAWRRRPGTRFVLQAHGSSWTELRALLRSRAVLRPHRVLRSLMWLILDIATYQRFDRIVCVSDHVRSTLSHFPYHRLWQRTPLELIVNGVPDRPLPSAGEVAAGRRRLGYRAGDRIAVCVARLDRQKGIDRSIEALALMPPENKLVVVGDGPERAALEELAHARGLADRVTFTGAVSRDEARRLMGLADVFVLPARNAAREGLPLTVLEALQCGLRVVVAREARWPADLGPLLERVDAGRPEGLAVAMTPDDRPGRNRLPDRYGIGHAAAEYHRILSGAAAVTAGEPT